jgi:3-oxoacyl-[acyl-carrier-protein] synthase II
MFGGWEITEPSLRGLYRSGYTGVSPYIASAWFPTAAQGQITIRKGFKGFSKTIAADTAGAALAVGYAARAVQTGRADLMLCGGAEAPVTPYAYTFCLTSGRLAAGAYHPFHQGADGFCIGEGAVVLALEDRDAAVARGARVHAELAGFACGHAPADDVFGTKGRQVLAEVIGRALDEAETRAAELDYVGLDAQGASAADRSELVALAEVLGDSAGRVPCTTIKPVTGHLLGAAPAVELAGALLAMRTKLVPPIAGCERPLSALDLVTGEARSCEVHTALVCARGADGTVAACVLKAAEPT